MQNYLVTGATSGIGEGCVRSLIENGNVVVAIGRNEEKLNSLSEEYGASFHYVPYDLSNLSDIGSIFTYCKEHDLKFDGMVYSAGEDYSSPIKANSIERMRRLMDVNCLAFVEMARHFYSKRYSNDDASIVAISSIASLTNETGMVAYSASKAALNSAVKTMSKEFVGRGIRVNAILPGGVDTPLAQKKNMLLGKDEESIRLDQKLGTIPVEQIVNQVEYLLSEKAGYMTGELIVISGGRKY